MVENKVSESCLADVIGHGPGTISYWLRHGNLPLAPARAKLIEISAGRLTPFLSPPPTLSTLVPINQGLPPCPVTSPPLAATSA